MFLLQDFEELADHLKEGLEINYATTYADVFAVAFPNCQVWVYVHKLQIKATALVCRCTEKLRMWPNLVPPLLDLIQCLELNESGAPRKYPQFFCLQADMIKIVTIYIPLGQQNNSDQTEIRTRDLLRVKQTR